MGCRLLWHPNSHAGSTLPSRTPPQDKALLPGGNRWRSQCLLPLQFVLSPSSAAGAMERWEGGSGPGGGSIAAWLLAQGSISPDFGFPKPKPDCTWGLQWYSCHQTGGQLPCLFQPAPLQISPLLAPRTQSSLGSPRSKKGKRLLSAYRRPGVSRMAPLPPVSKGMAN